MDMKPSSFLVAFICRFLKMVSYPFIVLGRTKEQGAARGSSPDRLAKSRPGSTRDSTTRCRPNSHHGARGACLM